MNLWYLIDNWDTVFELTLQHIELSLISVFIAFLFALPMGIVAARYRPLSLPVLGFFGAVYTIPSLALLAVLIPFVGIGVQPAIITLTVYAQVFLLRNIIAGMRGVDPATLEAARAVGMTSWQVFYNVHLPLALPIILAGIRIALVTTISMATITAWINAGGLGALLFNGIARDNPSQILAGTIAVTALAILVDQIMRLIERVTAVSRARRAALG